MKCFYTGLILFWYVINNEAKATTFNRFAPINYTAHPDGFWFGTQNLNCAMYGERPLNWPPRRAIKQLESQRFKRSVEVNTAVETPQRFTLRYAHRLLFFRGHTFEWGVKLERTTTRKMYYIGKRGIVTWCPLVWEEQPAGYSTCAQKDAKRFAKKYESRYGQYNILNNNCHHFANRLVKLLTSNKCQDVEFVNRKRAAKKASRDNNSSSSSSFWARLWS